MEGSLFSVNQTVKLSSLNPIHRHLPQRIPLSTLQKAKTFNHAKQLHAFSLKADVLTHHMVYIKLLSLYTDPNINHLCYAESFFPQIPNPTVVAWNLIIKCYVHNQRSNDALCFFRDMILDDNAPDNFTLPSVIKGCAKLNAIQEGKQIHGLGVKLGFSCDMYVLSSLVNMYAKCGEIVLARSVFDQMDVKDLVSWNSLIDGYCRCGEIEVALKLFDQMPERDLFSWTVLVDGLSKSGNVKAARDVFDRMPERNLVSWNAMINGYMKVGEVELAEELFNRMPDRNLITWNSIISGYVSNERFMEAVKYFKEMLKSSLTPNQVTLVSALSAVSGLAVLSIGGCIHSYLTKRNFELDGVLGTSLIDMYSKCGSIRCALGVFKQIARKKLGHWTAVIVGLGLHGMATEAFGFFSEMIKIGLKPNAITFIGILNACSHAGLVSDGRHYFDLMTKEYKITPTVEHYGCLVDVLCRAGQIREARRVIEIMPMKPNKVIWMSLLGAARNHGDIDSAEYAAEHLIEVAPYAVGCYVLLSNIYAAAKRWDKVSHIRELMKQHGIRKDPGSSSIEHNGRLNEFIVGDKAHPETNEIYVKLAEMRENLKCKGHTPDTSQVLLCIEGEKEKENELGTHSERLAIAYGLINVKSGPIRVIKNLRVCNDCHAVIKLLSEIYDREIIVRDNSRFHHFKGGTCSCMDYW
ncbi:unnamed protein product [Rhodiola kirilowii]